MVSGIAVIAMITMRLLNRVILIPKTIFKNMIMSVTRAIDKPMDKAILSTIFKFLKNTSDQAKPGRKKTSRNPPIPLRTARNDKRGEAIPNRLLKSSRRELRNSIYSVARYR